MLCFLLRVKHLYLGNIIADLSGRRGLLFTRNASESKPLDLKILRAFHFLHLSAERWRVKDRLREASII